MESIPGPILDLLLPATDGAVAVQVAVVVAVGAATVTLTRRSPHWRVFATGATLLLLGLMGLRALH